MCRHQSLDHMIAIQLNYRALTSEWYGSDEIGRFDEGIAGTPEL
jgi:hypothetical protein